MKMVRFGCMFLSWPFFQGNEQHRIRFDPRWSNVFCLTRLACVNLAHSQVLCDDGWYAVCWKICWWPNRAMKHTHLCQSQLCKYARMITGLSHPESVSLQELGKYQWIVFIGHNDIRACLEECLPWAATSSCLQLKEASCCAYLHSTERGLTLHGNSSICLFERWGASVAWQTSFLAIQILQAAASDLKGTHNCPVQW